MWNHELETLPRRELEKLQGERLRKTVERVYHQVPFYRQKLEQAKIRPEDIKSVKDLERLPFTTKQDLRDNYPFGLFAVPQEEIVRIHASSGTTGKMTVVGYTRNDLDIWAEVMARTLGCGDVTKQDVVQVAYGYGLFTGGLGAHYGAEKIGAAVIPISGGNTKRQLQVMVDFKVTTLACTPSYALYFTETAAEEGIDIGKLPLRVGFLARNPGRIT